MRLVLDSSALAKRYVEEVGSDEVEELLAATSVLGLCIICTPEVVSALNRRHREGVLTADEYRQAKAQLAADVKDATVLNLTPAVIGRSVALLERSVLRAMDSLHVACAIEWGADLFVSSDHRQVTAAGDAGLEIRFIAPPKRNT